MRLKSFLFIYIYSFFLLLLLSPDSYLYDLYHRCDSAWFFTCGKAWMNGQIPYVDFADSKGPLLWLIYGCGYLIHHYSYVGVFWMSNATSLFFAYKLSKIFISTNSTIIVLALLPIFLFYKKYHYEVRAEDFCYPFIFASLYSVCKILKGEGHTHLFRYAFVIGACVMCTFLIKWSVTMMMSGLAFIVLYSSLKNKTLSGIYGGIVGLIVVAVPFLLYFLLQGNFSAFIFEYFCNTYSTVEVSLKDVLMTSFRFWLKFNKLFIIFLFGIILFCRKYKISYWVLFGYFTFLLVAAIVPSTYYLSILTPFGIFSLIYLLGILEGKFVFTKYNSIILSLACCVLGIIYNIHTEKTFVFEKSKERASYYEVSQLMSQIQKPKVIYFIYDTGLGVLADNLPACKYWARQNGATSDMEKERKKTLALKEADFIVFSDFASQYPEVSLEQIKKYGYVFCGKSIGEFSENNVYCKKELYKKLPHYKIRTIDLLLKRNLFCKK